MRVAAVLMLLIIAMLAANAPGTTASPDAVAVRPDR
ncbi:MAG: hypothetical protein JWP99_442 [Devosia sp.]|jgi:hypothetical protein|nr:hypothetical protein [Devosia sp.]